MTKKILSTTLFIIALTFASIAQADNYKIDIKGQHAFIQFKISHLGYSWLLGGFDKFDGSFSFDEKNPKASKISVKIDTASINSNHALRDKHLRGEEFLDVEEYPQATFVSTGIEQIKEKTAVMKGKLTLHGITKEIAIDVKFIDSGFDPWGGYRAGFEGTTTLVLADYNITKDLGPSSKEVELFFYIEGVRQEEE